MMTIGVCVSLSRKPVAECFESITKMGFHHCQLMSWDRSLRTPEKAEEIKAACKKYEVTVTALWCGWSGPTAWNFYAGQETLGLVPPAYRFARMQDLTDGADFAGSLGITDVVTHMGFVPENPYDALYPGFVAAVRSVAAHLQANGQYLLFETGQETPVTLLRLFEDVGLPSQSDPVRQGQSRGCA